jgi:aryl-alcohol dehydrogenase-like predicted oxidoreductase
MTADTVVRRIIGGTDIEVCPLCLGGNGFGWTADQPQSFAVLDAYLAGGGNFIDTADQYSNWVPGHQGGESERIIGNWLRDRGVRDSIVLATKVGAVGLGNPGGLTRESILRRTEASLTRLGVDCIDVLYAHHDDPATPLEESMEAFREVLADGTVRCLGASNYTAPRLSAAFEIARAADLRSFSIFQTHYNLLERGRYEESLAPVVARERIACVAYWALAKGFLTGKYRDGQAAGPLTFSDRAERHRVRDYATSRNLAILHVLEDIGAHHGVGPGPVALAWTLTQPTITATVVSARNPEQLAELLAMLRVDLTAAELETIDAATAA